MPVYDGLPRHLQALRQRLRNVAAGRNVQWLERTIANVAVAQMLPAGVVKGGTAMRLRGGIDQVRFSTDLDTARPAEWSADAYAAQLEANLAHGWSGFTGVAIPRPPAMPLGVPADYVMLPSDVKLRYRSDSFMTVQLELGHDEIDSTSHPTIRPLAVEIVSLFTDLGLEAPVPVPLLASEYQIVQKLHACTAVHHGGNDRAHDLVDLQLLYELDPPDLVQLVAIGERLFRSRRQHPWPPVVQAFPTWPALYEAAAVGLPVRPLGEAVDGVNARIRDASRYRCRAARDTSCDDARQTTMYQQIDEACPDC